MLAGLLGSWACITRADTTLSTDIPSQPMADALAEFAHQTRLQFIYVSKIVKARVSPGAHAGQTAAEALPLLLNGTGLDFAFLNSRTVRIFESGAAAPAAQANATAAPMTRFNRREPLIIGPDEVVVTGLRNANGLVNAEDVQSIAGSVSVVGGDTLEAQKLGQLSDYAAYLPGLNLDLGGVPGFVSVQIRGIATLNDSPLLTYYIDDAPIGPIGLPAGAPDLIPYDLERLEVQRGPQGTLGGTGSESGLIRYVLNEPNVGRFEARVGADASATHYAAKSGTSLQAMMNVPIIDDVLAVRVSAYDTYTPGFIDNAYSGAKDVNVQRRYGGRITALWYPADSLSVKVTALWNRIDADSSDLVMWTGAATAVDAGDANIYKVSKSWGQYTQDYAFLPSYQADHSLFAATLHWNPSSIDIVSTTTWSRYRRDTVFDSGYTGSILPELSGGAIPAGLANLQNDADLEKFSDELRIASPPGRRIEWLLGSFYTYERLTDRLGEYAFDNNYQPIAFFAPAIWSQVVPSTFRKWALFGDLTWRVTDHLDLTGGIRHDHNDQAFSAIVVSTIPEVEPAAFSGQYSEGVTTWATTARYHFTPDVMLYGHVATGSQPGSTNGPGFPPVNAEHLTNYELGLKSEFLDRKGMIDLTVFYIDWEDIQVWDLDPELGGFFINGGTAVSRGVELASSWSPFYSLKLGYNAAYTQSELTKLVPSANHFLTGYQLPQIPKWSMSFTADYDWALTGLWDAHVGGAYRWIGPLWSLAVQSRSLGGAPTLELPSYSILDLNASVAKGPLVLRAFARNLADTRASRHGHLGVDDTGTIASTDDYMVQPRTFGIGFDYSF